jgi:hypothetical protein
VSLARRRAAAQLLDGGGPRDAADVVRRLLAVQAQDARAWPLALRARGVPAAVGDPVAAPDLGAREDLVTAWLLRGTLHLVAAEDHGWLLALTGHLVTRHSARRLAELEVDPEDTAVVLRALDDGPRTRPEVAAALDAAGVRADGQRTPHLLALAAAGGGLVLGLDGRYRRVAAASPAPDRDAALAELARRYLRGHGPADARDLAAWSGLALRDARAGLAAIAGELADAGDGRAVLADAPPPPDRALPEVLLPAFDPYLLGWRDRGFAVPPEHARTVHPGGGVIRATIVADGRVTGTWRRDRGRVVREPFATP